MLAAAGKLIEKEGLASLSVREAARRAGVSHNAPYRHFPDRDALLAALATEGFTELKESLKNRSGRKLGEAYLRFALAHPQRFRLMFAAGKGGEMRERFAEAFAGLGAEANVAAAAAWSLVHGLAGLILDGHLENSEDFVKRVLGAIRLAVGPQRSA
ncbi:MAG TPA: TetR/AcrR family transcriptional regulator [Burkholderiales bacterium]|nr:TetR/AcrR family transcriptional regulator [Burkholderiales bacterium]